MNKTAIETYLHTHIPLSREMGVSVVAVDDQGVRLAAPLLPNINHRSTAFGGSISALAILSAWTLVHVRLQSLPLSSRIVIQSNTVDYLAPIDQDFQAYCPSPADRDWQRFVSALTRRGKGRIQLTAQILAGDRLAGRFSGDYVAISLAGEAASSS